MRRYAPLKASSGTRIPDDIRHRVARRDRASSGGCVGRGRLPAVLGDCSGALQLDHVRASGGMGMKSVTCDCNLVQLCWAHHRYKTENGKTARPILLEYLATFEYEHHDGHAA